MQLLRLGYPDRGSPGRKESGPTTAPIGGHARPVRFHGRLRMVRRNIPAQGRRAPTRYVLRWVWWRERTRPEAQFGAPFVWETVSR
jgi:hypothetical protein